MTDRVKVHSDRIKEVTLVINTTAYTANDVLSITAEITNVVPEGMTAILEYIQLTDYSKNNAALQLWFLDTNTSIGTINAAENAADAVSDDVVAYIDFAVADYVSEANWSRASKNLTDIGMGAMFTPAQTAGTVRDSSIWIASKIITDAKTYAVGDLKLKIGFMVS